MDPANPQSSAPDSWDADMNEESVDTGLNKPLGALNINAAEFVPGQNPFASSFVPSGPPPESGTGFKRLLVHTNIENKHNLISDKAKMSES